MTDWLKRLGVALRKVFVADPDEPLPDEFVRLCEALDKVRAEGKHPATQGR